jgi:hypothetical protein
MLEFVLTLAVAIQQRAREHDELGARIAPLNDVDGDSCADFALDDGGRNVWVVSGKSGEVIARTTVDPSEPAPARIAPLFGDVNGDGAWDIIERHTSREVLVRSGKDLRVLLALPLPRGEDAFLGVPAAAGDWDSDGFPDVAAVVVNDRVASVVILSGRNGRVLQTIGEGAGWSTPLYLENDRVVLHTSCRVASTGPASLALPAGPSRGVFLIRHDALDAIELTFCDQHSWLNAGVDFVGDADGDGAPDLVVRTWTERANSKLPLLHKRTAEEPHSSDYLPRVLLVSGRTGADLDVLPDDGNVEGIAAARIGDLDGDGVEEILVGAVDGFGSALIFSGKDRRLLWKLPEEWALCAGACRFGANVAALGDVDGDGVADFAITYSSGVDERDPGCVAVYSGKTRERLRSIWKADLTATNGAPFDDNKKP